jgi:hypothetical protein
MPQEGSAATVYGIKPELKLKVSTGEYVPFAP